HDQQHDDRRGSNDRINLKENSVPHLLGQRRLQSAADKQGNRQFLKGLKKPGDETNGKSAFDERQRHTPERLGATSPERRRRRIEPPVVSLEGGQQDPEYDRRGDKIG